MIGQFAIRTHMLGANLVRLVRTSASSVPFFTICFSVNPGGRTVGWLCCLVAKGKRSDSIELLELHEIIPPGS